MAVIRVVDVTVFKSQAGGAANVHIVRGEPNAWSGVPSVVVNLAIPNGQYRRQIVACGNAFQVVVYVAIR